MNLLLELILILGNMTYFSIPELVFHIVIVLVMPDGSYSEPIDVYFVDYIRYCVNQIACGHLELNEIFININHLGKKDSCDRYPITHEMLHFKYPELDVHNRCDLK